MGFNLLPKPLSPLQGRGLKNFLRKPPKSFGFWYRGTRDESFIGWRVEKREMQMNRLRSFQLIIDN
jgi:hypothetical protein